MAEKVLSTIAAKLRNKALSYPLVRFSVKLSASRAAASRSPSKTLYGFIDESFRAVAPARVLCELDR